MEGVLHKWTNYLSGWQPRYFVLDGTILSYYDSLEDVGKGSKGSIKMAVCEIKVHPTDGTRVDLVIPGEQCFYLRALTAGERQRWLVALGTAKACLADSRTKKEKELNEASQSLKGKMSELRLYCDLLMEQVHKIEHSVQPGEGGTLPDTQTMTDASSLLKETCNQFVGVLEDCMRISSKHMAPELCHLSPPDSPAMMVCPSQHHSRRVKRSVSHTGVITPDRLARAISPQLETRDGETVMRNLEQMAACRAQRRAILRSDSEGAAATLPEGPEEGFFAVRAVPEAPGKENGH
ncbi:pleckstrin homology domain-containing family A member 3-like isoform X2 [Lepisosteus oculatus]|uniref:pleckstrin homology domain-containing family A member 3-like isoform X2 n=1 Tax=Lepisosteus oculatus TaxID=7918 RepID=UPI0035F5071C